MRDIQAVIRPREASRVRAFDYFKPEAVQEVLRFHESFPQYRPTPLAPLKGLAETWGVQSVHVKDESYRFGLNAFKVLGGSYAIGRVMAQRTGIVREALEYGAITSEAVKARFGTQTFVTATDGNHGRGVAWTATALGQKSVVYMPKGSSLERLENIRQAGAMAEITEMNYDDAVRLAQRKAAEEGWIVVQDTAWEGYEEIPTWIMQGYATMAFEAYLELKKTGAGMPTHIFLQAGVGSMAAAVTGFFAEFCGASRPRIIIVEPDQADCIFRTAQADDGRLHFVGGDMRTIMAGLACGEPSTIGWEVLNAFGDAFISCADRYSAKGMRILGNPLGTDPRVISGESGSVGVGVAAALLSDPAYQDLKDRLGLDRHSKLLFFSTEGDTDRASYRAIVWDGKYPSCPEER